MSIGQSKLKMLPVQKDDPQISSLISAYEDARNLSEVQLYPPQMPTSLYFKISLEEETIGQISLKNIRWFNRKAEFAVFIKKDFRGRGLGKQILEQLMEYVFLTMNLHRLEAEVIAYNTTMIELLNKTGFRQEGELREAKYFKGKYYSIFRYAILRREYLNGRNNG